MDSSELDKGELVRQFEQLRAIFASYRRGISAAQGADVDERGNHRRACNARLRQCFAQGGEINELLQNGPLLQYANAYASAPGDPLRRREAGWLAAWSVALEMQAVFPKPPNIEIVVEEVAMARADAVFADVLFFGHYFDSHPYDPPHDPSAGELRRHRRSGTDVEEIGDLLNLSRAWSGVRKTEARLKRVEQAVFGASGPRNPISLDD